MILCRVVLTLALLVGYAGAQAQTVRFLGDLDTDVSTLSVGPVGPYAFGNLRTPGGILPDATGVLSFRAEIDSVAWGCSGRWRTTEVHLLLANPTDGPIVIDIFVGVDDQWWGSWYPSGCPEAGPGYFAEMANWYDFSLELPQPGYYELVHYGTHPCALFGGEYFLKCDLGLGSDARLVIDHDGARSCEVLQATHIGERWWWEDLFPESGAPESGAPIWWVEAQCCECPIANELKSWGSVKSLYR